MMRGVRYDPGAAKQHYSVETRVNALMVLHRARPQFAARLPRFCTDPPGFDRTAFHRDFDARIVAFFHEHLSR
jgi:hypothetical protein